MTTVQLAHTTHNTTGRARRDAARALVIALELLTADDLLALALAVDAASAHHVDDEALELVAGLVSNAIAVRFGGAA